MQLAKPARGLVQLGAADAEARVSYKSALIPKLTPAESPHQPCHPDCLCARAKPGCTRAPWPMQHLKPHRCLLCSQRHSQARTSRHAHTAPVPRPSRSPIRLSGLDTWQLTCQVAMPLPVSVVDPLPSQHPAAQHDAQA